MMVKNWCSNPKADVQLATWNAGVTLNEDGTRTYHVEDHYGTLNPFARSQGKELPFNNGICVVKFREQHANQGSSDAVVVRNGENDGVWAYQTNMNNNYWNPNFNVQIAPLTPLALAIYTPEDWERLQSMGVTLFDGDTMPLA